MGVIFGTIKFLGGLVLGATIGASIATLIVTRDPNKTLVKLQSVMADVVSGGREAAAEEEARLEGRRQVLIGAASQERLLKAAEKKKDKDKDKKKK